MLRTGGGDGGKTRRTRRLSLLGTFLGRPSSAFGAAVVIVFLVFAAFGPWIAPYSATQQIRADARQPPSARHFFGTDHLGRDVFSRVVLGTGSVVGLAGLGTALAVLAGTLVGLVSGYRGGWLDEVVMRLFDSLLAIPALLLALLFLGALGPTRSGVALVLLVVYMPIVARVVRSQVLATKSKAFVEMARLQGEPLWRILLREILPSALPALSVEAALRFSYAIFLVASLGFLGVGVGPPSPNWGLMVSEARIFATLTPWALFFPAGAIALLVVSVNLTADGLKQALLEPGRERGRPSLATAPPADPPSSGEKGDEALLALRDLTVDYLREGRWRSALREVSLDLRAGEICAVVGESGSGKSTLALALLRYLSPNGKIRAGVAELGAADVLRLPQGALRRLRGQRIAFVPQDPQVSLNPSLRVGEQMVEQIRVHKPVDRGTARARAHKLLANVDIGDPDRVARSYPHQLSGGMQQRVMIAMALSADPELLVLDEPTTGLDVTTQAVVLDLLREVIARHGTAALYITHNLGVVAQIAHRVAVLYAGELVEEAPVVDLFARPLHPYTQGLMASVPLLGEAGRAPLASMPGRIPALGEAGEACVFAPRCPLAIDPCRAGHPQLEEVHRGRHRVRCVRWAEIESGRVHPSWPAEQPAERAAEEGHVVLSADRLVKHFPGRRTGLGRQPPVRAVDRVDLRVAAGKTLGLVGESGSGKSTLARLVAGLEPADAGALDLRGRPLPLDLAQRERTQLAALQMVFQNPDEALNPYVPVGEALVRPLVQLQGRRVREARAEVRRLLELVRLPEAYARRRPQELSGGERQRVALARAFAARPALILLDEPTSSLDVSVQASLLNLLRGLQREQGSAYVFISHDLAVVGHLADAVAVLYRGRVMELGATREVFAPPYHPYTEALLSSVPLADPNATQARTRLPEATAETWGTRGCPFHTRCPRKLGAICETEAPPWRDVEGDGILCHIPLEELCLLQAPVFGFSSTRPCGEVG